MVITLPEGGIALGVIAIKHKATRVRKQDTEYTPQREEQTSKPVRKLPSHTHSYKRTYKQLTDRQTDERTDVARNRILGRPARCLQCAVRFEFYVKCIARSDNDRRRRRPPATQRCIQTTDIHTMKQTDTRHTSNAMSHRPPNTQRERLRKSNRFSTTQNVTQENYS